ncbi:tripartite tricarboxylate transporter permease [Marinovum sp. 2_MG-2023]|uniref:tripartite tricarboxylate transporter permease n=1 Tax=unclassified Marinovum TaxID=2647166 RepID=UPI0026E1302F|nr:MULTISPECIES: tripartite tricarboxylate transporter permease [unclassified Marinovum]MDO6732544.1 tripartite tricarboxylate transporter permease [Marinovum sp. 2_MG-2023]MDO6781824.1 tripartite tricarboxylate transporter permease [Marinovum sp. 1_MG-2023]
MTAGATLFAPFPLMMMFLGVFLGIVVGAIPGLSATMLIALALPMTYLMKDTDAMTLLVSMYVGGISGGLISAILINMPGTPSSIFTTLDGFPMARQGKAARALALGVLSSLVGGVISFVLLLVVAPPLASIALRFGPWEFFAMVMMALVLISSLGGRSFSKGIMAGFLGMLFSLPGIDPTSGNIRFTFGIPALSAGLSLLPVLVGTFALSQVIQSAGGGIVPMESKRVGLRELTGQLRGFGAHKWNMLRSSLLGTWIGLLPGIGGNIAAMVAYSATRSLSKTPERFGKGAEEGLVSTECANNASIGGSLIPLISLGIPGSTVDAILIGALLIHNVQLGPLLIVNNPEIVFSIVMTYGIANFVMFAMMISFIPFLARLVEIPRALILAAVSVFCVIGTYAANNRILDVWVLLFFGVLGAILMRLKLPLGPFVIGFVLAPIAEAEMRAGIMLSNGKIPSPADYPIAAGMLVVAVLVAVLPVIMRMRNSASLKRHTQ